MPLTIDLPPQLRQELEDEAQQEGVSVVDHATLLLYLVVALLHEPKETPFQHAVELFLSQHSLDADLIATVFEELVRQCLTVQQEDKSPFASHAEADPLARDSVGESLRTWRSGYVHRALMGQAEGTSSREMPGDLVSTSPIAQSPGQARRRPTAMGKYAFVPGSSDDFAREKQDEIAREDRRLR